MKKKIKIDKMWMIIGIVGLLLIGGVVGSKMFPETRIIQLNGGQYCYDKDFLIMYQDFWDCTNKGINNNADKLYQSINQYANYCSEGDLEFIKSEINHWFGSTSSLGCYHPYPKINYQN